MLQQTDFPPATVINDITQWRILNEATIALSKATNARDVVSVLVQSFNKMGHHVFAGLLDLPRQTINIEYVAFNNKILNDRNYASSAFDCLANQQIELTALPSYKAAVDDGSINFWWLDLEDVRDVLKKPSDDLVEILKKHGKNKIPYIMAPIRSNHTTSYLFFLTSDALNADYIPIITAFVNLGSAIMENHTLLQRAEDQKRIAQTLQKVSTIVGSSLDLKTVLELILEQLSTVITYDSSAILLEESNTLKLEAGRGFEKTEEVLDIVIPADNNVLYQEFKREQKPIVMGDVRKDSRYALWAGTNPIRSWVGVPLIWKNQTFGQISIDSFQENAFTQEDGELALTFAQHVATAINNARLFKQINQTASELRALLDSARDVASTLDTEKVIYLMSRRVKNLMQADLVDVYLISQHDHQLTAFVSLDETDEPLAMEISRSVATQSVSSRRGIILNQESIATSDNTEENKGLDAFMAVPFIVKDQAIGAITMCRLDDIAFKQADLDLLTRFALQTGIAIENSRLYEQMGRRLKREAEINRFARRLSSKLSLASLSTDIMETAKSISGADVVSLVLVDPGNENVMLQYDLNSSPPGYSTTITTNPAMVLETLEQQKILLTDNLAAEAYSTPTWVREKVQSAIAVPLTSGDEPWGVLGMFTINRGFDYSAEILNTLESLGRQAGVAIENAFLFQQVNDYAHNLAEQVEARTAEIRTQKEQTDAILAGAADAIVITSAEGTIEYINPAFTNLTGYFPEEVIDKNPRLLKSAQTSPNIHRQLWRTILGGNVWRGELKNKRKDDSLYDADLTIAPIFNQHGQIDKFVGIQRDISKLRELDRLKTEFLGTAAHELRSPLTTIRGYAELLMTRPNFSKEEIQRFVGYIHEQAVHLADLVSDLLDVSKIESGSAFSISPEKTDPRPIFIERIDLWQSRTNKHTIKLIEPETWPELKIDRPRLGQALGNLLSNAIKYSPAGGDITVKVSVGASNLQVSITDQGIGMTMDEQKKVFEKFWRADASSTAVEGTGLGMVIVKHIIESHGGKIWVSSRRGEGTTFSFTLPMGTGLATILIVEDEINILELQQRFLSMEGYQVLTAQTGTKGLELALSEHPDLIILDLMLPEINGEDVLKKLKSNTITQHIPVVIVSAKSGLSHIEKTFSLGAVDFLTKPFDLDEYLGRIKIAFTK